MNSKKPKLDHEHKPVNVTKNVTPSGKPFANNIDASQKKVVITQIPRNGKY